MEATVQFLQRFTDRLWYPPLIGFLALIDAFIIIVPTDGILISSAMLKPKKWIYLSFCISIGSTIGAMMFFYLIKTHGLPWALEIYPGLNQGAMWRWSEAFFMSYGLILVFVVAAMPVMQHPAVILASLAHTPFMDVLLVIFAGRLLKNLIMAYISSHSPKLISKLWGVQDELDEVGIHLGTAIHKHK